MACISLLDEDSRAGVNCCGAGNPCKGTQVWTNAQQLARRSGGNGPKKRRRAVVDVVVSEPFTFLGSCGLPSCVYFGSL